MPRGSADAAGRCQPFQTRRNIHAIAENIPLLHHDVADVDADAKVHATIVLEGIIRMGKFVLDVDRALDGSQRATERGENTSPAVPQILPPCCEMRPSVTNRKADKVLNVPSSSIPIRRL
jgi:hypothetical protein